MITLIAAGALVAQEAPSVRSGSFELGLYGGASHGIDKFHPVGGINLSYSVTKHLLPYFEASYFPELQRREETATKTLEGGAKLFDLHVGTHIRFPVKEQPVVPYLVGGFGWIRSDISGTESIKPLPGVPAIPPGAFHQVASDAAVNFGGGLRYYASERWGVRAEYKLYRPLTGVFKDFFSKVEGGLFFQF